MTEKLPSTNERTEEPRVSWQKIKSNVFRALCGLSTIAALGLGATACVEATENSQEDISFQLSPPSSETSPTRSIEDVKVGDRIKFTAPMRIRVGPGLTHASTGELTDEGQEVVVTDTFTSFGQDGYFVWVEYEDPENSEDSVWSAVLGTNEADHGNTYATIVE